MHSVVGDHTYPWPGFPIRTPSDQRSIGNSPRPIVALHDLHRLIVPRHPPCALISNKSNTKTHTKHMNTTQASTHQVNNKITRNYILASTIQFSNNTNTTHTTNHHGESHELAPQQEHQHLPFQTPNNATNQATKPANTTTHTNNHTVIGGHASKPPPKGFLMPTIHPQTNKQKTP